MSCGASASNRTKVHMMDKSLYSTDAITMTEDNQNSTRTSPTTVQFHKIVVSLVYVYKLCKISITWFHSVNIYKLRKLHLPLLPCIYRLGRNTECINVQIAYSPIRKSHHYILYSSSCIDIITSM